MTKQNAQKARLTAAREELARMTTAVADSDEFRALLRSRRSFRTYSFNNTWLIKTQRPDAVAVKGFKAWIDLGRVVRKGEKAIWILAPRPFTKTETDEDGNEVTQQRVSYGTVAVFDISQTDPIEGHPNPFELPQRLHAQGDPEVAQHAFDVLSAILTGEGVTISTDPARRGEGGYYQPAAKRINITPGQPAAEMFAVLTHEAAHHYSMQVEPGNYQLGEIIAESIAYLVCDHFGFDARAASSDYLAHWLKGDTAKLDVAVDHIVDTAAGLIDQISEAIAEAGTDVPAVAA